MKLLHGILGIWMAAVCLAAFIYAPPADRFGDSSRILFFHVPLAWVSVLAFLVSMIESVQYLRRRTLIHDAIGAASARIGLLFTVLATVSGSIFARLMWNSFWNWDPRETTIVMLLLIYSAYLVLRGAIPDPVRRANLSAVYAIFAFLTVPFLVFIIPRLTFSLHPSDTFMPKDGRIMMSAAIQQVFFASLAGFTGLFAWLLHMETRIALLQEKETQHE